MLLGTAPLPAGQLQHPTTDIVHFPVFSPLFPGKTKTTALSSKDQERADESSCLVDSAFYLSPQRSEEL